MSKIAKDATAIIERTPLNDHQGQYNRNDTERKKGTVEIDTIDVILAQNKLLTKTKDELIKQLSQLP